MLLYQLSVFLRSNTPGILQSLVDGLKPMVSSLRGISSQQMSPYNAAVCSFHVYQSPVVRYLKAGGYGTF
jgi:hypothetical protein